MKLLRCGQLLALAIALLGCGQGTFSSVSVAAPIPVANPDVPPSVGPPYHAYGDSITAGYGLAHPATQVYAAVFAAAETRTFTDYGIGGDMSCDVPTRQIFAHADQPTLATPTLYSLLISTNDVGRRGPGAYEAIFNLCQQASIGWLAVPQEFKIAGTSGTTQGATHVQSANNWNAVFTDAPGATITFPFSRSGAGPVYVWYRILDGDLESFSYSLDGTVLGTVNNGTNPRLTTANGTTDSLALLRIPAVAAGAHTLVITQVSSGTFAAGIVALGLPPLAPVNGLPRVLVGTTPPQNHDTTSACWPDTSPCAAYTADITANVALFAGDGLNVQLFQTGKYMSATNADLIDPLHPNALGDSEIAHAMEDVY